ncbi:MAG TPA: hypothetical protein VGX95_12840 [Xanthobacteraceae bacterium]|jgi:hypothetical protein|nr:hypothetical protein [Xanthobacteraceae bacterium]
MRLARFLVAVAAVTMAAHRADAQPPAAGTISVAWPAPVGHFQPHAYDLPPGVALSPSLEDREFDNKLNICRGC